MLLVSFIFLGHDVKVEVLGRNSQGNKLNDNDYLKSLVGQHPSILTKNSQKYKDAFKWCIENNDFQDTTLERQSNFVFK